MHTAGSHKEGCKKMDFVRRLASCSGMRMSGTKKVVKNWIFVLQFCTTGNFLNTLVPLAYAAISYSLRVQSLYCGGWKCTVAFGPVGWYVPGTRENPAVWYKRLNRGTNEIQNS